MQLPQHLCTINCTTPLGEMLLASSDSGLAGVWFVGQKHAPDATLVKAWRVVTSQAILDKACEQLGDYFKGQRQTFDLPLDLSYGTAFEQSVWQALLKIKQGNTSTYGAIAQQLKNPNALRAVGTAVGRNPISIIVPCHRVLGKDGSLTGYAGGLQRKEALLQLEGVLV